MTQLSCGHLRSIANNPKVKFTGSIILGSRINTGFALIENSRAGSSDDAPDFNIFEVSAANVVTQKHLGAAWLKNSDRVRGGDFMSMTFDDPDWPSPINVTAFPPDQGNDWRIVWSRPRGARVQSSEDREAA